MELSILIPSRNEPYLQKTVDDIFNHCEGDTEVLIGLDGYEPEIPLTNGSNVAHRVGVLCLKESIGQRAITNELAKNARGEYIMKVDAHCSFSQGFDRKMLEEIDHRTILAPILMPLQGEMWIINGKKKMKQFVFDSNLVMQHAEGEAGETMCLQGSAWMVSKENYYNWNLGDETLSSWGGQGTELGIKAFLNGGRCMTTDNAYYGHVFRHGDSDFPYDRGENPGKYANEQLNKRFRNKNLLPLIEKFGYPADWKDNLDKLQ